MSFMSRSRLRRFFPVALHIAGGALCLCCQVNSSAADLDQVALTEVKGIFRSRCADCHNSEASSTDFDILDAASLIKADVVKVGDADPHETS